MICPKCGMENKTNYCTNCGSLIDTNSYIGYTIIGFFFNIIGFFIWLLCKNTSICKAAIKGVIISIIVKVSLFVLFIIIGLMITIINDIDVGKYDIKIDGLTVDEYAVKYIEDKYNDKCHVVTSVKDNHQTLKYASMTMACDKSGEYDPFEVRLHEYRSNERFITDYYYSALYGRDIQVFLYNSISNILNNNKTFINPNIYYAYYSDELDGDLSLEEFMEANKHTTYKFVVYALDSDYQSFNQINNLINILDNNNIGFEGTIIFTSNYYYDSIDKDNFDIDYYHVLDDNIIANRYYTIKNDYYDKLEIHYYELINKRYTEVDFNSK